MAPRLKLRTEALESFCEQVTGTYRSKTALENAVLWRYLAHQRDYTGDVSDAGKRRALEKFPRFYEAFLRQGQHVGCVIPTSRGYRIPSRETAE